MESTPAEAGRPRGPATRAHETPTADQEPIERVREVPT